VSKAARGEKSRVISTTGRNPRRGDSSRSFGMTLSCVRILAICGTRPDTVKMAPVVMELQKHPEEVQVCLAVTGQHREMLAQVLSAFSLVPDYDLEVMTDRQSLASLSCKVLDGLDKVIDEFHPDLVLAQGDTTTTFIASLASFYHKVPFGHVEAGLRTGNRMNPFPEEMNRRLAGCIADLHFAPTAAARDNLLREGIPECDVYVTGNTVIDALLSTAARPYEFADREISSALGSGRVILVTMHRRENWGDPMREACAAVRDIVEKYPDVKVIFSVHKNPIVREVVFPELSRVDRVLLIEPPEYVPFVHLMKNSYLVVSDSGGVQEEAPSLGKPVLVLRTTTERMEGVEAGSARLVGTDRGTIVREASRLLDDVGAYRDMSRVQNPYGDGKTSERIWDIIKKRFS